MFIAAPLKTALEDSISSGKFIDTKFWVFHRRNGETGRLEQPRAVFANCAVVRSIPYLSALLDEVPEGPLDADFPQTTEEPLLEEYEYQSDSDLVDEPGQTTPPISSSTSEQDQIVQGCKLSVSRLGRTVIVKDAAFATFHAILEYLYTREIDFKAPRFTRPSDVPLPSAKSVYRLADKYGIPDLKELALLEIKSDIKKCNIIEESFGKFVSWYPEIQELYMYQLARAVRSSDSPDIAAAFDAKIQEYFAGKLPHAKDLVLGLFDLLANNRMSPHPSPPGSSHSTITPYSGVDHGSWIQLMNALTLSLTTGIFLDLIFYAEDSTELRPLFFCSSVMSASIKKISVIGKFVPASTPRDSSEGATPRGDDVVSQDVTSERPLVVTSGDFRTWKAILCYIYTAKISFAPLGSSASSPVAGSSSNPVVSHEGVDMKLVYELATKIVLKPLRDVSYQKIKSSMTAENIIEELFSTFSTDHEPIRKMQHRLLQQEFWTPDVLQGLRTKVEQSGGQASHYGPTMVAVFRDLARGRQAGGWSGAINFQPTFNEESLIPTAGATNQSNQSNFYSEVILGIPTYYQTITTTPTLLNTSQEELRLSHYQQNHRTTPEVR